MTHRSPLVTVLGARVPPGGVIDAHGHLWIDPVRGADKGAPVLADERAIVDELASFRAAGGAVVIDCQPPGCGRNLTRLVAISSATGIEVVASTGFHLARYYPRGAWPWTARDEDVVAVFVEELDRGVPIEGGRTVRAGVIKAADTGSSDDEPLRLLACACEASASTGAAIVVHTERGAHVERLADFLLGHGVPPRRVVLCHVDKRPDRRLHAELAVAGFVLEYDTFLREQYDPDRHVWPLLASMLEEGYASSIACGLDLADASLWRFGGAPVGMVGLLTVVRPRLAALGASAADIDLMLRGNIAARIARERPVEAVA